MLRCLQSTFLYAIHKEFLETNFWVATGLLEGLVPLEVRKIKYPQICFFNVMRIVPKEVGITCDLHIYVSFNIYYSNTFRHTVAYQ